MKKIVIYAALACLCFISPYALAQMDIGGVALQITKSMEGISKLITSAALVAGMGFTVGAIMKFKQHKDNPTQIPVGTPIALLFIAAALLYLPTIFSTVGQTLFGDSKEKARISGVNVFIDTVGGSS